MLLPTGTAGETAEVREGDTLLWSGGAAGDDVAGVREVSAEGQGVRMLVGSGRYDFDVRG